MHSSMRRSVGEMLVDSLLGKRDITSKVTSVKDAFSSWDNCMQATYCKFVILSARTGFLLTILDGQSLLQLSLAV